MNAWIYDIKLSRPQALRTWLRREKLNKVLDQNSNIDIIQVMAPAGFGKSMAISHWINEKAYSHMWYSLDESDDELSVFLSYLLRGMVLSGFMSEEEYESLYRIMNHSTDNLSSFVLNLLVNVEEGFYLVFDDFHFITNLDIFVFLNKLMKLKNDNLRIIVISREGNVFPSVKNKIEGHVIQIGMSDLSLSRHEIRRFLSMQKIKDIKRQTVDAIFEKTEGWLMGVQLLSIDVRKGIEFKNELAIESSGAIRQYMIDEILMQEDRALIDFVYKTSIADYFNISICEKIMDTSELVIESMILKLIDKNLFLIKLEQEQTFRYHHLFKEALDKTRGYYFEINSIVDKKSIQLKIADWYKENNMHFEASSQYISIKEYSKAVNLLTRIWPAVDLKMQQSIWRTYVDKLPDEVYSSNPVIFLGLGWTYLQEGNIDLAKRYFKKSLSIHDLGNVKTYHDITLTIPLSIKLSEVYIALIYREYDGLLELVNDIFTEYREIDRHYLGILYTLQACAYWAQGEFLLTEGALIKSKEYLRDELVYNLVDLTLIELYCETGYLKKADFLIDLVSNRVIKNKMLHVLLPSLELYKANLYYFKGDIEKAYERLECSEAYGKTGAMDDWEYKALKLKVTILISQDLFDEAQKVLAKLYGIVNPSPIPEIITLDNLKENMHFRQVHDLMVSEGAIHNTKLKYLDEYSFTLVVASYLIKNSDHVDLPKMTDITSRLEELYERANRQKRPSSQVTLAWLLSICYDFISNQFSKQKYKEISMRTSDETGYILPHLLFSKEHIIKTFPLSGETMYYMASNKTLQEPLSKRELDVLKCMSDGLSNREIGEKLFLSEATIKSYNKGIYRKLEVSRRAQAVIKGQELGIIKT